MTIPIVPGPFSFLAELGKGVGTAFGVAEQQRRTVRGEKVEDRAEALKQVGVVFDAVQNNQLSASALKSEFFRSLVSRSGLAEQFAPEFVAPKPEEQVREGQSEYLRTLLGNRTPGNEPEIQQTLATGKIQAPEDIAQGRERTAIATTRAEAVEAGGAPGRAVAQVPTAAVATVAEEGTRDVFYDSVAGRSVDAAITRLGGDILKSEPNAVVEAAWQDAQMDARSRGYVAEESVTRPYIEAAVAQRMREALKIEAQIRAASARGAGNDLDNYLNTLRQQQSTVIQQIRALPPLDTLAQTYAYAYETKLAEARTPEQRTKLAQDPSLAFFRAAYDQVKQRDALVQSLNNEANGLRDELQNALRAVIPGVGGAGASREGQALPEEKLDAFVQRMRQQKLDPAVLDAEVSAGRMTAGDAAKIKARLTSGSAKETGASGRF